MSWKWSARIVCVVVTALAAGCGSLTPEQALAEIEKREVSFDPNGLAGAVMGSDVELVELFVTAGYDVNAFDQPRKAPLMLATRRGHGPTMKVLLDAGARADRLPGVLNTAASQGDLKTMSMLLDAGADIDGEDDVKRTALLAAIEAGRPESVRFALDHGATADGVRKGLGRRGTNPLIEATKLGQIEIVRLLLAAGADVNRFGGMPLETALIAAARLDRGEIAALLLEAGADPRQKQTGGDAIEAARRAGNEPLAQRLEQAGAR